MSACLPTYLSCAKGAPRPTALQVGNVLAFLAIVAINALSSLPSRVFGQTNADVSNAFPTAFTPAGYAFSIWGVIYALNAAFVLWQLEPLRAAWVSTYVGSLYLVNALFNCAWIISFAYLSNVPSAFFVTALVISLGILGTLLLWMLRLDAGRSGHGVARPAGGSLGARAAWLLPARPADITVGEWLCVHTFISLYAGWVSAATIANVSIVLTPRGGSTSFAGWSVANWSVLMMCVADVVGLGMLLFKFDVVYAGGLAWALIAIGFNQAPSSPPAADDLPGGQLASTAGFVTGGLLAAVGALVLCVRAYRFFYLKVTRFPAEDDTLEGAAGAPAPTPQAVDWGAGAVNPASPANPANPYRAAAVVLP